MQIRAKKHISIETAKLAIFPTDMLWESCSKLNFRQLFHSMSVANMASLAGIQGKQVCLFSLDTGQTCHICYRLAM